MQDSKRTLLKAIDDHCSADDKKRKAFCRRIAKDARFYDRLTKPGATCSIMMFDRIVNTITAAPKKRRTRQNKN